MTGLATSSGPTLLGKLRALEERMVERRGLLRQATTPDQIHTMHRARADLAGLLPQIIAEIERDAKDADESEALREKMAEILTATANALKGNPKPLTLHSWHDLAEVATALKQDRNEFAARVAGETLIKDQADLAMHPMRLALDDARRLSAYYCNLEAEVRAERDKYQGMAERYSGLIRDHNEGCKMACDARQNCLPYTSRSKTCPDCPMDDVIYEPADAAKERT